MDEPLPVLFFAPHPVGVRFRDVTNEVFGNLTVLGYAGSRLVGHQRRGGRREQIWGSYWWCRCKCGRVVERRICQLTHNRTNEKQCGRCFIRPLKHGLSRSGATAKEFRAWAGMRQRCQNPNVKGFENYGGRGIYVCPYFEESPANLVAAIGFAPSPVHSVDRIDSDGSYTCGRCSDCLERGAAANLRWALKLTQTNNRRNVTLLSFRGVAGTLNELARHFGIPEQVCYTRSKLKRVDGSRWSLEEILTIPPQNARSSHFVPGLLAGII